MPQCENQLKIQIQFQHLSIDISLFIIMKWSLFSGYAFLSGPNKYQRHLQRPLTIHRILPAQQDGKYLHPFISKRRLIENEDVLERLILLL